jgi:hypothetical protein
VLTSPTPIFRIAVAKPISATTLKPPHSSLCFAKALLQVASTSLDATVSTQLALSKPLTVTASTPLTIKTLASASQSAFRTLSGFLPMFTAVLC